MEELNIFIDREFQWLLDNFENLQTAPQTNLLTIQERVLLYKYTDDFYELLNSNLRNGTAVDLYLNFEHHLNTVLSKLPNYEGLVYRGANLNSKQIQNYANALESQTPVQELAFVSSSKSRAVAKDFTSVDTLFRIYSRKGKDIVEFSRAPEENEVLFASRTQFVVLSVTKEQHLTLITLEEYLP